jgi:hypothetical protein
VLRIQDLVPNDRLRDRILVSFENLSPPPGSGYRFSLMNGAGRLVTFDESLASRIQNLLNGPEERAEVQTVTGELQALDFSEGKLTIFYLPKSRELECFYDETIEPMLLEKRRDLIQVTGPVAMDVEGYPKKMTDVDRITDVDLTPFVLNEVTRGQIRIRFREPLTLVPKLTESQQLMFLEDETFGIEVFAPSRSELLEELKEQVIMLWTEYATEDDDNLSDLAKALKKRLLSFWEAASNG